MKAFTIEIDGLSVAYDHKRVLNNIYLKIEPGYIYGLIGPNGAGKSTLFKCILQQVKANVGEIKILGEVANTQVLKKIAYVPQKDEVDMFFPATVEDIVLMGRFPHKTIFQQLNDTDKKIGEESMSQLGILNFRDRQIGELSGGQQQRVFLARALCQQADILLMDEPFVGVDAKTEHTIIHTLKELSHQGKTILVVHHDLDSVSAYFDRVIMINQRLIAHGDTSVVFNKENISKTYSSQSDLLQYLTV
jgi:ABC-type Mn2+/Zn2+ transport system ATPase subunit